MLFEIFEILKNPHKRKNLTMKKFVSLLLVLTMLVTVFAGLAVTASAADALLSVYTPPKNSRSLRKRRLTATAISTSRRANRMSS